MGTVGGLVSYYRYDLSGNLFEKAKSISIRRCKFKLSNGHPSF